MALASARSRSRCSGWAMPMSAAARSRRLRPNSSATPYSVTTVRACARDVTTPAPGDSVETRRLTVPRAAVEGMLGGLGAGLQALRALGVPLKRALLIGGGAQSEAVRMVAPQALGMPVEVPAPGEYVALGAARQAASVLAL